MSWTEATFTNRSGKQQQVWVKTDDDGELVVEDGLVPMRYQQREDAKVYHASPRNIENGAEEPDAPSREPHAESREPNAQSEERDEGPVTYDDGVWKEPVGERVVRTKAPRHLAKLPPPPDGVIEAWTDGACTGNPGPCGFGLVLRFADQYIEIGQYLGLGTNNIAELDAIRVAVEEARNIDGRLHIHTDSSYSIGVLTKGWKAKANVELIHTIRALVDEQNPGPEFVKVKGHAGIPLNERADTLAVEAVERRA